MDLLHLNNPTLIHFLINFFCLGFEVRVRGQSPPLSCRWLKGMVKTLPRGVTASLIPTPHNVFPGGLSMFLDAVNGCLGGLETPHRRHLEGL